MYWTVPVSLSFNYAQINAVSTSLHSKKLYGIRQQNDWVSVPVQKKASFSKSCRKHYEAYFTELQTNILVHLVRTAYIVMSKACFQCLHRNNGNKPIKPKCEEKNDAALMWGLPERAWAVTYNYYHTVPTVFFQLWVIWGAVTINWEVEPGQRNLTEHIHRIKTIATPFVS